MIKTTFKSNFIYRSIQILFLASLVDTFSIYSGIALYTRRFDFYIYYPLCIGITSCFSIVALLLLAKTFSSTKKSICYLGVISFLCSILFAFNIFTTHFKTLHFSIDQYSFITLFLQKLCLFLAVYWTIKKAINNIPVLLYIGPVLNIFMSFLYMIVGSFGFNIEFPNHQVAIVVCYSISDFLTLGFFGFILYKVKLHKKATPKLLNIHLGLHTLSISLICKYGILMISALVVTFLYMDYQWREWVQLISIYAVFAYQLFSFIIMYSLYIYASNQVPKVRIRAKIALYLTGFAALTGTFIGYMEHWDTSLVLVIFCSGLISSIVAWSLLLSSFSHLSSELKTPHLAARSALTHRFLYIYLTAILICYLFSHYIEKDILTPIIIIFIGGGLSIIVSIVTVSLQLSFITEKQSIEYFRKG